MKIKETQTSKSYMKETAECVPVPDFKKRLEVLEAAFSLSYMHPSSSQPLQTQNTSCWVSIPINQKCWIQITMTSTATFEELFYSIMNELFPGIESFSSFDYYFLWVNTDEIIRPDMGEYVINYDNPPRFILRHIQHGIQGAVISNSVHIENLEASFHQIREEFSIESSNVLLFAEKDILSMSLSSSQQDNGVSLRRLLTHEDKTVFLRLPYDSFVLLSWFICSDD